MSLKDPAQVRAPELPPDTLPATEPVPWIERASTLRAAPFPAPQGAALLAGLWQGGRLATRFDAESLLRLAGYLQFASVPAGQVLIHQDEPGEFMLIVLEGSVGVERAQTTDRRARLAEARPGDVLGEMALLDAGPRFSACTTRTPCVLAVLEMEALTRLMHDDARLALALMAALARRLSLRLRQVSARLSALLTEG